MNLLRQQKQNPHNEPHEKTADGINRQRAEREKRPETRPDLRRNEITADRANAAAEKYEKNRLHDITLPEFFRCVISV